MTTEFEKNIYCPNEMARAIVHVDNTQGEVDATAIAFSVKRSLNIHIDKHSWHAESALVQINKQGPLAGEKKDIDMELDLGKIRTDPPTARNKKGH